MLFSLLVLWFSSSTRDAIGGTRSTSSTGDGSFREERAGNSAGDNMVHKWEMRVEAAPTLARIIFANDARLMGGVRAAAPLLL